VVEAYARGECNKANNAWLAGAGKQCILSDQFYCVPAYGVQLNHKSKTEDFGFVFQSVSRANTVNMNAPPQAGTMKWAYSSSVNEIKD
jgi:hypothetical protein